VQNPDLFGWSQHPKRYVLINTNTGRGNRLPWWWRRLFWFAHRRSLARADAVAAERPTHADDLRSFGIAEARLSVFPPVLKAWDWMPSREASRRRLELPQEAAVILCVSRLSEEKTRFVLDLVNALARLPSDVFLVLVGDGPGRQQVEHKVAELKLDGHVRVVGFVPHEDVRWFYAACDSFAYPDPVDRMSLAILEAQACGRPVVAMATNSVALIVDAGRTGLLAKDLDEFQVHLAALAGDRAHCDSMGQAGPEYVAEFHSLETRIREIEDLLLAPR